MRPLRVKRRPTDKQKECPHCKANFNARGYMKHEQACRSRLWQQLAPAVDIGGDIDPDPDGNWMSITHTYVVDSPMLISRS